jgi:hypothetical protein
MQTVKRRSRPNRPHIPSFVQISKSEDAKQPIRRKFRRNLLPTSRSLAAISATAAAPSFRVAASRRFGEAVFTSGPTWPQEEKCSGLRKSADNCAIIA